MINDLRRWLAAALLVLMASAAPAQETPSSTAKKPTDVTADQMEILDAEKTTTFTGNVVAVRDKTTIKAPKLVVISVPVTQPDGTSKDEVDVMQATGGVTIVTDKDTITSDWANIYDRKDLLEAGGNVTLVQDRNTLKGQKLNVNLKTKHTVMSGGRVNLKALPQ